jgi:mannose-1-phosphate guanylyltransferase/mannose-6-phosphate isomerase
MKLLVLAGGGGTRLWPLSRQQWPKQFLSRPGADAALVVETIRRVLPEQASAADALQSVLLMCSQPLLAPLKQTLEGAGLGYLGANVLVEPAAKNTAPAIALALQYCLCELACPEDEVLVVLPSDHYVDDPAMFKAQLQVAAEAAQAGGVVTLGVPPTAPETGYGYIELPEALDLKAAQHSQVLAVSRFVEKPTLAKAQDYLASQRYLWNAGIFVATLGSLKRLLASHAPQVSQLLGPTYAHALEHFKRQPSISFDYAVMEKAEAVQVLPLTSGWSDLGSWDSWLASDSQPEQTNPEHFYIDSEGCWIEQQQSRPVALVGLEDCLVVDTPDALLVCKRGQSQQVKQAFESLKRQQHPSTQQPALQQAAWGSRQTLFNPSFRFNPSFSPEQNQPAELTQWQLQPGCQVTLHASEACQLLVLQGEAQQLTPVSQVLRPHSAQQLAKGQPLTWQVSPQGITFVTVGKAPQLAVCEPVTATKEAPTPLEAVLASQVSV